MQNLLSQVQLGKYGAVTLYIGFLEIVEQAAALTNHLQKAATGVMVFAVVTDVCRKGKWIKKGNPWWDFFAGPWVALIKLRPLMLKLSFIVPKGLR